MRSLGEKLLYLTCTEVLASIVLINSLASLIEKFSDELLLKAN